MVDPQAELNSDASNSRSTAISPPPDLVVRRRRRYPIRLSVRSASSRWHRPSALINQHILHGSLRAISEVVRLLHLDEANASSVPFAAGKATTMGHIKRSHLADVVSASPAPVIARASEHLEPLSLLRNENYVYRRRWKHFETRHPSSLLSGEIACAKPDNVVETSCRLGHRGPRRTSS